MGSCHSPGVSYLCGSYTHVPAVDESKSLSFLLPIGYHDLGQWRCYGVGRYHQGESDLVTFDQLKARHNLANSYFFRHLSHFRYSSVAKESSISLQLLKISYLKRSWSKHYQQHTKLCFFKHLQGYPDAEKGRRGKSQIFRGKTRTICGITLSST